MIEKEPKTRAYLIQEKRKKGTRYRIHVSVFGRRSIIHMGERLKSSVSSALGGQNPRFYCECKNNEQTRFPYLIKTKVIFLYTQRRSVSIHKKAARGVVVIMSTHAC